ncbi:MAG: hypothetical protein ABJC79_13965, partial [Acidimicrobiia bacterium]
MSLTLDRRTAAPPAEENPPVAPTRTAPSRWSNDAALVMLVALGAGFRLWSLGAQKLNYDESFTAMAGRRPFGDLLAYLTAHDSHPPLDYLLRAPLARAGVNEFWFRFPSAVCSIAALVMLALWLRPRGRIAVIATGLFALSAFQIAHGRDARMYAELEVLGVGIAILTDHWLRRPARYHAPLLGALVLVGLYTHISMFLLALGLLAAAGLRRDRNAWRWRGAIVGASAIWAVTWGPHFVVQAQGGHSSWIPATTFDTLTTAIARAVSYDLRYVLIVVAAVVVGAVVIVRRDRHLARAWVALFAVPVVAGGIAGLGFPVVLDRTFTLMAWAPAVALAFLFDAVLRRQRLAGLALVAATAVLVVAPSAAWAVGARSGPTDPLTALDARIRPGDVIAVRPASKQPEMLWSLAVRNQRASRPVVVSGLTRAFSIRLGTAPPTGRTWYLDWSVRR